MLKSFFGSLIHLCVVILISVVIFSFATGYRIDFQKFSFFQTGAIHINSSPTGANVYINNQFKGTTPISILSLIPNEYNVTVSFQGYYSYNTHILVSPDSAKSIDPILTEKQFTFSYLDQTYKKTNVYFGKDQFLFTTIDPVNSSVTDIYSHTYKNILNINFGENTSLIYTSNLPVKNLTYSPNESRILLLSDSYNNSSILNSDGTNFIQLSTVPNINDFNNIMWGNDDNTLIMYNNTEAVSVNLYNLKETILYQTSTQNNANEAILNVYPENYKTLIETKNNSNKYCLYDINNDGTDFSSDFCLNQLIQISSDKSYYSIYNGKSSNIYNSSGLYATVGGYNCIYVSQGGNYVICTDNSNNYYMYTPENNRIMFLTKSSEKFNNVYFSPYDQSIIFEENSTIYMSDINMSNIHPITSSNVSVTNYILSPNNDGIIYSDTNNNVVFIGIGNI